MRQLNKLKVAITAGIILLIIIAIVALVLKLNNNTYFSKEASIDTVINLSLIHISEPTRRS